MASILIVDPKKRKPAKWIRVTEGFLVRFNMIEHHFSFENQENKTVPDLIEWIEAHLVKLKKSEFLKYKYQKKPLDFAENILLPKLKEFNSFELGGFYPF